jgi:hypothetical protein
MRRQIVLSQTALSLAGCATMQAGETRATEQLLAAAGFQMRAADTPGRLAHLQTLKARTVLRRSREGEPRYVYADPQGCKCLYVGTEQQYQEYRTLAQQKAEADERLWAAEESQEGRGDWGLRPWP